MAQFIREQRGIKYLEVDSNLYSPQAINSTIYKMAELCPIQQKQIEDSTIQIFFNVTEEKDSNVDSVIKEFLKILADQQLRLDLDNKFSEFRDIIVKKAFSQFDK